VGERVGKVRKSEKSEDGDFEKKGVLRGCRTNRHAELVSASHRTSYLLDVDQSIGVLKQVQHDVVLNIIPPSALLLE